MAKWVLSTVIVGVPNPAAAPRSPGVPGAPFNPLKLKLNTLAVFEPEAVTVAVGVAKWVLSTVIVGVPNPAAGPWGPGPPSLPGAPLNPLKSKANTLAVSGPEAFTDAVGVAKWVLSTVIVGVPNPAAALFNPSSPFGPRGPTGPTPPVSPFGPRGPTGPTPPVSPCGPRGPVAPLNPLKLKLNTLAVFEPEADTVAVGVAKYVPSTVIVGVPNPAAVPAGP